MAGKPPATAKGVKPTMEQVIAYAKPIILKFLSKTNAPDEHRDEMEQCVYLRLIEAYPGLNADDGWKSFTYTHTRGAILDYLKYGAGFSEGKWSLKNSKEGNAPKLTSRVTSYEENEVEEHFNIDRALGAHGIFNEPEDRDKPKIKWELLARMCSVDENLHAFAKMIRGLSVEEMAPVFGLCRTRVSQMIQAFLERFDDGEMADNPWFKQTCFALGVCPHLGMADLDQTEVMGFSIGWNLNPVDLDSVKPHHYLLELDAQMGFFDGEEEQEKEA